MNFEHKGTVLIARPIPNPITLFISCNHVWSRFLMTSHMKLERGDRLRICRDILRYIIVISNPHTPPPTNNIIKPTAPSVYSRWCISICRQWLFLEIILPTPSLMSVWQRFNQPTLASVTSVTANSSLLQNEHMQMWKLWSFKHIIQQTTT